jgi:hypothetical protein
VPVGGVGAAGGREIRLGVEGEAVIVAMMYLLLVKSGLVVGYQFMLLLFGRLHCLEMHRGSQGPN